MRSENATHCSARGGKIKENMGSKPTWVCCLHCCCKKGGLAGKLIAHSVSIRAGALASGSSFIHRRKTEMLPIPSPCTAPRGGFHSTSGGFIHSTQSVSCRGRSIHSGMMGRRMDGSECCRQAGAQADSLLRVPEPRTA